MVRLKPLMLLALPASLLSTTVARGESPPLSGVTREDQREERFYNFDHGRQSGGGFTDPSDLVRKLQNARNVQYSTDPADTLDAALDGFAWPDESLPKEETVDPGANGGSGPIQIPGDLFPQVTRTPPQGPTTAAEETGSEEGNVQ